MDNLGFVVAGYVLTAVSLAGNALHLQRRAAALALADTPRR